VASEKDLVSLLRFGTVWSEFETFQIEDCLAGKSFLVEESAFD